MPRAEIFNARKCNGVEIKPTGLGIFCNNVKISLGNNGLASTKQTLANNDISTDVSKPHICCPGTVAR